MRNVFGMIICRLTLCKKGKIRMYLNNECSVSLKSCFYSLLISYHMACWSTVETFTRKSIYYKRASRRDLNTIIAVRVRGDNSALFLEPSCEGCHCPQLPHTSHTYSTIAQFDSLYSLPPYGKTERQHVSCR